MNDKTKAVMAPADAAISRQSPLFALGQRFSIEPTKLVDVLRGTVIKPTKDGRTATNEEIAAFCMVANQYGLNPFTREIHAFADPQKGVVPIVGIDGWCHIVNSQPGFDGVEFCEVSDEKGKPVSVTCVMHIKGREHPTQITEYYSECYRPTGPWNTMPRRMLRHKAFMQCGRYAFSLSGIFDEDEARDIAKLPMADVTEISEPREKIAEPAGRAKGSKDFPGPTDPVAPPPPANDPSDEQRDLVALLEPYADGFPKRFSSACADLGIDAGEFRTAPADALSRLLAKLDDSAARQ